MGIKIPASKWPGEAPDGTSGEDEGANLEALADAFRADPSELLSWRAFVKGTQGGSYTGGARKAAEKLLAWAGARGLAEREQDKPQRVYLTPSGTTELAPFWHAGGPDPVCESVLNRSTGGQSWV